MLFPALGMTTAIWLLTAPLLGLETGFRAGMSVGVGSLALVLALLSTWYRRAGVMLTVLGFLLGFLNFGPSASVVALAATATSALALVMAGMAPWPVVVPTRAAVEQQAAPAPAPRLTSATDVHEPLAA